jgi:rubrerythrin
MPKFDFVHSDFFNEQEQDGDIFVKPYKPKVKKQHSAHLCANCDTPLASSDGRCPQCGHQNSHDKTFHKPKPVRVSKEITQE